MDTDFCHPVLNPASLFLLPPPPLVPRLHIGCDDPPNRDFWTSIHIFTTPSVFPLADGLYHHWDIHAFWPWGQREREFQVSVPESRNLSGSEVYISDKKARVPKRLQLSKYSLREIPFPPRPSICPWSKLQKEFPFDSGKKRPSTYPHKRAPEVWRIPAISGRIYLEVKNCCYFFIQLHHLNTALHKLLKKQKLTHIQQSIV